MKNTPEIPLHIATAQARADFGDIPIEHAMIAWNGKRFPDPKLDGDGRVLVIPHPDRQGHNRRLDFQACEGACTAGWKGRDARDQVAELLSVAWMLVIQEKLDPKDIHDALQVIPEYREWVEDQK